MNETTFAQGYEHTRRALFKRFDSFVQEGKYLKWLQRPAADLAFDVFEYDAEVHGTYDDIHRAIIAWKARQ